MGITACNWHPNSDGFKHKVHLLQRMGRESDKLFVGCLSMVGSLHPGLYQKALESPKYYLFTGGGTVLKVIEEGDPFALPTVKALIANGKEYGYKVPTAEI